MPELADLHGPCTGRYACGANFLIPEENPGKTRDFTRPLGRAWDEPRLFCFGAAVSSLNQDFRTRQLPRPRRRPPTASRQHPAASLFVVADHQVNDVEPMVEAPVERACLSAMEQRRRCRGA